MRRLTVPREYLSQRYGKRHVGPSGVPWGGHVVSIHGVQFMAFTLVKVHTVNADNVVASGDLAFGLVPRQDQGDSCSDML
jgi:hypothetical protein